MACTRRMASTMRIFTKDRAVITFSMFMVVRIPTLFGLAQIPRTKTIKTESLEKCSIRRDKNGNVQVLNRTVVEEHLIQFVCTEGYRYSLVGM